MNKLIYTIALVTTSLTACCQFACSGLDRVDIYLNNRLIATATVADAPVIKLDTLAHSDTLTFHTFTNWEGLRNSTMDIESEYGELIDHINSSNNTGYEATFTYVLDHSLIENTGLNTLDVTINLLCERDIETEQVSTIRLVRK